MSDNEGSKAKTGWTDKERLTYLFALIENSNVKFDYNNTPRPAGRSVIACQRMMERMKSTLKTELEALKSSNPISENGATPKKTPTPRKRKGKTDGENGTGNADGEGSPRKRGRPKKNVELAKAEDEEVDFGMSVKTEPKDEELEFESEM